MIQMPILRRTALGFLLGGLLLSFSACREISQGDPGRSSPGPRIAGNDGSADFLAGDFERCEKRVAQVGRMTDIDALAECIDWYWHNGGADIGFNKIIKLGYRIVDLDPRQTEMYTTLAWLLWSKWVTWKSDPAEMPDGERKVEEAIALLKRGRSANPRDAAYHLSCGHTLMPLAQIHRPDVWPFVVSSFELADGTASSQDTRTRLMARMGIAHAFRYQEQWESALAGYLKAMEVTPEHRPALMNAGLSARKLRRFDEALGFYDRVLKQLPSSPSALLGRAHVFREAGSKALAILAYEAVLKVDPTNAEAMQYLEELKKPNVPGTSSS